MATRLRVALVGQAAEHRLVKLELVGTREALRDRLITSGLQALGVVPLPTRIGQVQMFLDGGAVLDDATMLEKDDTVYFSLDGGPWREPNEMPQQQQNQRPEAAERKSVQAGGLCCALLRRRHQTGSDPLIHRRTHRE
tara:strand:- start:122 stop:535 length:414 start_codon:yes stop_codon:yes gene_type:complete|eukprot:scaffold84803_cov33-Phaeocystis_antarctica.AAC.2